jgi:glycosyltransferase involved in cell wall biosynthesis
MKFIFWQNIVSPHMSYFLRNLSEEYEVVLVVDCIMSEDRLKQGWEVPNLGKLKIIIINDLSDVLELINVKNENQHFFSGFNISPLINKAFKLIIKKRKVNLICESGIELGIKKYPRLLKYSYLSYRYNEYIENFFAMGDLGVNWYKKTGFNPNKIHKFQYTIELPNASELQFKEMLINDNNYRFTFVGQLIVRKGIDNLINALSNVKNQNWHLNIIGDGIMKNELLDKVEHLNLSDKITFIGSINNQDVMTFLTASSDYLILPSRFDGWGAVVNEALSRGVKVVTNQKCGASCMIRNDFFGKIYKEGDEQSLVVTLEGILDENRNNTIEDRIKLSTLYKKENQEFVVQSFIDKFFKKK